MQFNLFLCLVTHYAWATLQLFCQITVLVVRMLDEEQQGKWNHDEPA